MKKPVLYLHREERHWTAVHQGRRLGVVAQFVPNGTPLDRTSLGRGGLAEEALIDATEGVEIRVLSRVAQTVEGKEAATALPVELESTVQPSRAGSCGPLGHAGGRGESFEANPAVIGCSGRHRAMRDFQQTGTGQES